MLIIKHGKKPVTYMRFKCGVCGCDFIADSSEYVCSDNFKPKRVFTSCPTCGKHVCEIAYDAEVPEETYNRLRCQYEQKE